MPSKIIFYTIVMIGVIFSIMTSAMIASYAAQITGRPQTLVFKIGRFVISNHVITYELNLTGIHNPTSAKILLGGVSENGVVVADLLQPDSSKTKDGTLIRGSITDTSLQGPMKGKSLSDLITAMRDGNTYVKIDTSTNPKGEIRGQIKIHGSASNQIADINLVLEEPSNDSKLPKLLQKGGGILEQPENLTSDSNDNKSIHSDLTPEQMADIVKRMQAAAEARAP